MPSSETERRLRAVRHHARRRERSVWPTSTVEKARADIEATLRERASRILNDGLDHSPQAIRWAEDVQKGVR